MDSKVIAELKTTKKNGQPIGRDLAEKTDIGSGAQREIDAYKEAGLEPPENAIRIAEHAQYGEVHRVGKSQTLPGSGEISQQEIEAALVPLEESAAPAVAPSPPPAAAAPGRLARAAAWTARTEPKVEAPAPKVNPTPATRTSISGKIGKGMESAGVVLSLGQAETHEQAASESAKYFLLTRFLPAWVAGPLTIAGAVAMYDEYRNSQDPSRRERMNEFYSEPNVIMGMGGP
jgi:hypothetical protein